MEHRNTLYVDRYKTIMGREEIQVGMPVAPEKVIVEATISRWTWLPWTADTALAKSFRSLCRYATMHQLLQPQNHISNPVFTQFCAVAGYSDAGGMFYYDKTFEYGIKYLDSIPEAPETPQESTLIKDYWSECRILQKLHHSNAYGCIVTRVCPLLAKSKHRQRNRSWLEWSCPLPVSWLSKNQRIQLIYQSFHECSDPSE